MVLFGDKLKVNVVVIWKLCVPQYFYPHCESSTVTRAAAAGILNWLWDGGPRCAVDEDAPLGFSGFLLTCTCSLTLFLSVDQQLILLVNICTRSCSKDQN